MDIQDDRPLFHKGRRYGCVYHTIFDHPKRGLLHYIGQKIGSEPNAHYCGSGLILNQMIRKYGRKERVYRRLVCYRSTRSTLNRAEIRFIKEAKLLYGTSCLNLSFGGEDGSPDPSSVEKRAAKNRGRKQSVEEIEKRVSKLRGQTRSKAAKERMSASAKGRKHSEETKAKIAAYRLGKKLSEESKAKVSAARIGKTLSKETKAKISASLMGNEISLETRKKLSEAFLGKPLSEETKAKKRTTIENQPKLKCPHCNLLGSKGPMTRYHFDRCKRLQP